jgi:hypothetical protein
MWFVVAVSAVLLIPSMLAMVEVALVFDLSWPVSYHLVISLVTVQFLALALEVPTAQPDLVLLLWSFKQWQKDMV